MTSKPKTFTISDILQKDSKKEQNDIGDNQAGVPVTCPVPTLPTPPTSPEVTLTEHISRTKSIDTPKRKPDDAMSKRRDPIGRILDSLGKTDILTSQAMAPSAFSPIMSCPGTAQLSPLAMLAKCDRRCYQTSPNMTSCYPYMTSPVATSHATPTGLTQEQIHFLQAQRLAHQQQQIQQQQHIQQQQRFALAQGINSYLMQGCVPQTPHQLQSLREQQAKTMTMDQYNASLLAQQQLMASRHAQNMASPFLMSWMKSADSLTSYPPKESRIPPPPRYQCEDCKKSYSTFGGLSKHKQFHCVSHVKKEFNCKYCDKSYGSLGALKMHIRTHTLPCKCKLCGKAFSRPWLLQGHVRTHTGEKPFKCAHCGRAFADRSNLRAHLQTHSDIKKYGCKNCSKTFSRMSLLLKHEEGSCMGLRR